MGLYKSNNNTVENIYAKEPVLLSYERWQPASIKDSRLSSL